MNGRYQKTAGGIDRVSRESRNCSMIRITGTRNVGMSELAPGEVLRAKKARVFGKGMGGVDSMLVC